MRNEDIIKKINNLQISSKRHRLQAIENDIKIVELKKELSRTCKHKNTKIVTNSYEEPGRIKYFEWKEKVCKDCGKIVATLKEEKITKWIKHE